MAEGFCAEFGKIRWKIIVRKMCAKWISSLLEAARYYRRNLAELDTEKPVTSLLEEPLCADFGTIRISCVKCA